MEHWQHDFDQTLWKGDRTHEDANQPEYDSHKVKNFIFNYIIDFGEKPKAADLMAELNITDRFFTEVVAEINIYDHEEEMEFREESEEAFTNV